MCSVIKLSGAPIERECFSIELQRFCLTGSVFENCVVFRVVCQAAQLLERALKHEWEPLFETGSHSLK